MRPHPAAPLTARPPLSPPHTPRERSVGRRRAARPCVLPGGDAASVRAGGAAAGVRPVAGLSPRLVITAPLLALALSAAPATAAKPSPAEAPPPAPATSSEPGPAASVPVPPTVVPATAPAVPYAQDERMQFDIDYLGLPMGKARISVGRVAGLVLPVFLEARTAGLAGAFDIREQLASYLDVGTGLPSAASLDAFETGYRHSLQMRFDRGAGTATVRDKGRKSDQTWVVEVPPGTVDFVALVFRLRRLPLDPGSQIEFHVIAGKDVSRVLVQVVARETLETRAGTFRTVKVRVPTGFGGKFSEKSPTFVWLSDDARRIVVRLSTDFAIGRAVASLVSYEAGRIAGAP